MQSYYISNIYIFHIQKYIVAKEIDRKLFNKIANLYQSFKYFILLQISSSEFFTKTLH